MNNATKETRACGIIKRLKMFNRKEREHLMKMDGKPKSTTSKE